MMRVSFFLFGSILLSLIGILIISRPDLPEYRLLDVKINPEIIDGEVVYSTNNMEIIRLDPDGRNSVGIAKVRAGGEYVLATPSGDWIFYHLKDSLGYQNIYRIRPDGSNQENLTYNSGSNDLIRFSPDKEWLIIYSTRNGTREIFRISLDGRIAQNLSNAPDSILLTFSPDNQWIIFSVKNQQFYDLYKVRLDGTEKQLIAAGIGETRNYEWSLDGKKVVFESFDYSDNNEIDVMVMSLTENMLYKMTNNAYFEFYPRWSPDGNRIIFSRKQEHDFDLYSIHTDSGILSRLTYFLGDDFAWDWSRDGRWLYFSSDRDSRRNLFRVHLQSGKLEQLTHISDKAYYRSWSSDGVWLIYEVITEVGSNLYRMLSDGSRKQQLTKEHLVASNFINFSPDDRWIYFNYGKGMGRMKLDGSEQRILTENHRALIYWLPIVDMKWSISRGILFGFLLIMPSIWILVKTLINSRR